MFFDDFFLFDHFDVGKLCSRWICCDTKRKMSSIWIKPGYSTKSRVEVSVVLVQDPKSNLDSNSIFKMMNPLIPNQWMQL